MLCYDASYLQSAVSKMPSLAFQEVVLINKSIYIVKFFAYDLINFTVSKEGCLDLLHFGYVNY